MYKKSIYNIVTNEVFLWNTRTGAIAMLSPDDLDYYNSFFGDDDGSERFSLFKDNQFFVPEEVDELLVLLNQENEIFMDRTPSDLFFVIAPTLRCNYACEYCFESTRDIRTDMSKETTLQVLRFIESNITENEKLERIHITFFGGEPLLRLDIVDILSDRIRKMCIQNNIEYRPTIITNGRFLNDTALSVFKRDNFKSVQISIDSIDEKYCSIHKASPDDFSTTIKNVFSAANRLERVIVRINVRNHDFSDAQRVADILFSRSNVSKSLRVYLANVNEGEKNRRTSTYIKFVDAEEAFIKWLSYHHGNNRYFYKRPLAKGVSCRLSCDSNFCIGPKGELYKCEYHFGKSEYIVGNVKDGYSSQKKLMFHKLAEHGKEFDKCKNCSMLPICMGGCINNKIQGEKIFDCAKFIEQMIRKQVNSYLPYLVKKE